MAGVRRAFVWASVGRYVVFTINLAAIAVVARLVTPADYGISVFGLAVLALAEGARELGGGTYIIQQSSISSHSVRTTFTISLIVTLVVAAVMLAVAEPLARFVAMPELASYLRVAILGYLVGPFILPTFALMGRELAFSKLALISVAMTVTGAATTIWLAAEGFRHLSFAWASVVSAITAMLLCLWFQRHARHYRPSLREWRAVAGFGVFDSATSLIVRIGEALPYLILGKLFDAWALGICQRAALISFLPERIILAGVGAIALPQFSKRAREGRDLGETYIVAMQYICAVLWPALILIAALAQPIVLVFLGHQWVDTIPLVQIICAALCFCIPINLQYAVLVASGAMRLMPALVGVQGIVTLAGLLLGAPYGLAGVASSLLITVPANATLSMLLVHLHVPFAWRDLATAVSKSLAVTLLSALGPLGAVIFWPSPPPAAAVGAAALSAIGWLCGTYLTGHPLANELSRILSAVRRTPIIDSILERTSRRNIPRP